MNAMADVLPLWPSAWNPQAPLGQHASLRLHLLEGAAARPCIMVCPGGGYGALAPHEGGHIADWLNTAGFHAAVLSYRLGSAGHRHPAMIHDAQRGLRLLRHHAPDWQIKPDGIGVLGFSAGGHLASSLAVHHARLACEEDDLAPHVPARPDAAVLCYPVIDMAGAAAHTGSRTNLLGPDPDPDLCELMSTHRHVDHATPPTFLWHTAEDAGVAMDNSVLFAQGCRAAGVPVELHIYPHGRHGLGLADGWEGHARDAYVATWADLCLAFLRSMLG